MKWGWIFVFVILVFLPLTGSPASEPYVCDGKYKDGGKPDQDALKRILMDHAAWYKHNFAYKPIYRSDTLRANLCNANLSDANLSDADLSGANLSGANLNKANLSKANLNGAYLIKANLRWTDLSRAALNGANLSDADLSWTDLSRANISDANLSNADLSGANLSRVKLSNADMSKANLSGANMSKANLSGVNMSNANMSNANLSNANLSNANLSKANLSGVNMSKANLSGAKLINTKLINTILDNAKLTDVNLKRAEYEPISTSNKAFLSGIQNLDTVHFDKERQSGLVLLRRSLEEVGLRELERRATYAIEKGKTDHATSEKGGIIDNVSSWLEQFARRLFFEHTAGYGLYPGQSLIILLSLIPVFAFIYLFSIYKKPKPPGQHRGGIYRIWLEERIRKDLGSAEPELITAGFIKSIGYALYFSLLSAFDIGWRDINVGNWIARIQPREYTLRSTGWVRTVSGIQSLISIYLLVFWVLTQFGRPFN